MIIGTWTPNKRSMGQSRWLPGLAHEAPFVTNLNPKPYKLKALNAKPYSRIWISGSGPPEVHGPGS